MLVSYKVGIARLATFIVEFSNPTSWPKFGLADDNKESDNLFISEHGRNEEAEVLDVIDEEDER